MPLPAPRTWADGEEPENIPTADDLNLDWRDSFDFLLGYSRPMIYLGSNIAQALTATVFQPINWQQEFIKRGGMLHDANDAYIQVPYAGQYVGYCVVGLGTFSTTSTRAVAIAEVNGSTNMARFDMSPQVVGGLEFHGSLTLNLYGGDLVRIVVRNQSGTVSTTTSALNQPKLALWYAGDFEE